MLCTSVVHFPWQVGIQQIFPDPIRPCLRLHPRQPSCHPVVETTQNAAHMCGHHPRL